MILRVSSIKQYHHAMVNNSFYHQRESEPPWVIVPVGFIEKKKRHPAYTQPRLSKPQHPKGPRSNGLTYLEAK